MNFRHWQRLAVAALAMASAGSLQAATDIFAEIRGIPGESREAGFEDMIEVRKLSTAFERQARGKPELKRLRIHTGIDRSTPRLLEAFLNGQPIPNVNLLQLEVNPEDGSQYVTFTARLRDVLLTRVEIDNEIFVGSPTPDEVLLELLPLEAEWFQSSPSGPGNLVVYFDIAAGVGDLTANRPIFSQPGDVNFASGDSTTLPLSISDQNDPVSGLSVSATSGNPALVPHPGVSWNGSQWELDIGASPVDGGTASISVTVSDGVFTQSRSFTVFVDRTGTPYDGFEIAYFTEAERADPVLSSPIGDPDDDGLETALEFLLGSNPRVFTPQPEVLTFTRGTNLSGNPVLHFEFDRRIDEPAMQLFLTSSPDGHGWTRLDPATSPLYEGTTTTASNPLFETESGTFTPPTGSPWTYLFRLEGVW